MAFETGTASDHVDLYNKLKTFIKAGANAQSTLTLTGNAGNGETVTIAGKTYTFQTTLTDVDGNVKIGANAAASLNNLKAAINGEAHVSPQVYATAMTTHTTVRAVRGAGDTLVVRAKTAGTGGNALGVSEAMANGSWPGGGSPNHLTGGGAGAWTEIGTTSPLTTNSAIFQGAGLSGTDEVHVGFGYEANVGTDAYALTGWMFRTYNALLGHQSQPGHSGLGYHPVWNQPTPYWFVANAQRIIVVTKVSTVYTASYLGKLLPYGTPGEWPQPYYLGMPTSANTRWSSSSENTRNFYDPGSHVGSRMLNPNGTWYNVANFQDSGGTESSVVGNNIWPFQGRLGENDNSVINRYRELRDNLDDVSYTLYPLILCGTNPQEDIWGELDGAFACSGFDAASEDIIEQDNEQHLLVQNIFRAQRYHYGAIKLY